MTLAREISLRTVDGRPRLIQEATGDFAALPEAGQKFSLTDTEIADGTHILEDAAGSVQRIDITLTPGTAKEFGLVVRGDGARGTRIGIRPDEATLIVDRRDSGDTDFHKSFPSIDSAPVLATEGSYDLTVYVDRCSVEVFAQGGQLTMTELIFPADTSTDVAVYAIGGTATINRLEITQFG